VELSFSNPIFSSLSVSVAEKLQIKQRKGGELWGLKQLA